MQYFPHAEGYVQHVDGQFFYIYHYTDHLGNIRLSYTYDYESGGLIKIKEENHYYYFGLKHDSYNTNRLGYSAYTNEEEITNYVLEEQPKFVGDGSYNYKFQKQERQDELGLNWDSFKRRNYDYALGRFMSIDPLAEDYTYQSPYNFAKNKVISHIEQEGLEGVHSSRVDEAGTRTHVIQKNIVVLTKAPRPIDAGASPERQAKIERKNERISKSNATKINNVKKDLDSFYSGAKNSAGESVEFQFNIIPIETNNTNGGNMRDIFKIANANGIESGETDF